jgi:hypothetical protein
MARAEIEDLVRDTLVKVARDDLGWDVAKTATAQRTRPLVAIFKDEVSGFSKYKLVRAFIRWLGTNSFTDLTSDEQEGVQKFFIAANKALA